MILDSLRNWAFYCGADSRLKRALEYLAAADLNTLEPGRYEIEGAEIFYESDRRGSSNGEEEASLEVHDKYIDVQVLNCRRSRNDGLAGASGVPCPPGPFDAEEDIRFLQTGRSFSSGSGPDSSSFSVPRTPMLR